MTNRIAHAFDMLADPTRRAILERIGHAPAAVGEIASGLPVSRPAVSQHLKLLKEAGLVTETVSGTRHIYRIDPRGLGAMRDWLDQFWKTSLDNFAAYAESLPEERK